MNEREFGAHIRRARLFQDITQQELSAVANISPVTLAKLETGKGSTVTTLIKVLRALGREDWLDTLEPVPAVSPMQLSRERAGLGELRRASKRAR